jgi:hypothetical protein
VIALISLAYLEEDGLMLSVTLLGAIIVITIELTAVWETVLGAKWILGQWVDDPLIRGRPRTRTARVACPWAHAGLGS